MLNPIDQPTLVLDTHSKNRAGKKRFIKMLRVAEARHKIEQLRDERVLHDQLSEVWEESLANRRTRTS